MPDTVRRPVAPIILFSLVISASGAPPALTAPSAARAWAKGADIDEMTRAETLLFAQDPDGALEALSSADLAKDDPRRLRLALDAFVALGQTRLAEDRGRELAQHDGWRTHAAQQLARLEQASTKRTYERLALVMFAACLAALGLAGARELLRPGAETMVFAAAMVASVVAVQVGSGILATLIALPAAAALALVHSAAAAVRRTRASVRGRMLACVLVLLGAIGAFGSVVARLGPDQILALLAA